MAEKGAVLFLPKEKWKPSPQLLCTVVTNIFAHDCEFRTMEKELIAMQLVFGSCNANPKKQLLQRAQADLDAFVPVVHAVGAAECYLSPCKWLARAQCKLSPKEVHSHSVPWQCAKALAWFEWE